MTRHLYILFLCATALLAGPRALAATYTVPNGPLPPGCSYNSVQVLCSGNLIMGNNDTINVGTPVPVDMQVSGDWNFGNNLEVNVGGTTNNLSITVSGNVNPGNNAELNANITIGGSLNAGNNGELSGSLVISGNLNLGNNSSIDGNVTVSGTLNAGSNVTITGDIEATNVNLGQNNTITGNIDATNVNVNGSNTVVDGNINATGNVNNNGTVTGYINGGTVNNNGDAGEVCDENDNEGPCGSGDTDVLYYLITHDGSALTCQAETIQVQACADAGCSTLEAITGTFDLQASGPGNYAASGSFSTSGTASVQLALPQAGSYTLSLANASVSASQATQCSGSNCTMTAVDTAFSWQALPTQTAGAPFTATLQAIRTDNQSGACEAALQGSTAVDLALTCTNPTSCSSAGTLMTANSQSLSVNPSYTSVTLNFNGSGVAQVNMNYEDAGAVSLSARKTVGTGAQLTGSSNTFVVRPASIGFSFTGPGGYPGGVFAKAGEDFALTLSALSANANVTPNFGQETSAVLLTLENTGQAVTPSGGSDGQVGIDTAFALTGTNGVFASNAVNYKEAGTARFTAHILSGDYLGTGDLSVLSPVTGRFIPWEFTVDFSSVVPACTAAVPGFTYMGQNFLVSAEVHARNSDGAVTANYPDGSVEATAVLVAADTAPFTELSGRLSPAELNFTWDQGEGTLSASSVQLSRLGISTPDGPYENLQLALRVDDKESGGPLSPLDGTDFNAAVDNCSSTSACNAAALDDALTIVFGRLTMTDTYGPESDPVAVELLAEYWNGSDFTRYADDSCTPVDFNNLAIISNPASLTTQPDGSVTTMSLGLSPVSSLQWTAPDDDGEIEFIYTAPSWLRYGSDNSGNPSAGAQFGHYRGHDRIIYWKALP